MGGQNYSLAIGCFSHLFIFLQRLPTIFFFSLYSFHLFIFPTTLQLPLLPYKNLCLSPIFHLLTIWKSPSLSNSLIFSNGTQDQEDFLLDLWQSAQPHPLGWSHKANQVPSIALQAIKSSFRQCTDRIGKFFKLFSFSSFALIFHFNPFLDL